MKIGTFTSKDIERLKREDTKRRDKQLEQMGFTAKPNNTHKKGK